MCSTLSFPIAKAFVSGKGSGVKVGGAMGALALGTTYRGCAPSATLSILAQQPGRLGKDGCGPEN